MKFKRGSVLLVALGLIFGTAAGCAPAHSAPSTQAPPSARPPAGTATVTPIPLPALTLQPGELYFSLDGRPGFLFSRNLAGYQESDYDRFLSWSESGGSQFVRIQLDSQGMGYMFDGTVDESWASRWDQIFDQARADGIYVLPVFSGWFDWNAGSGYSTWKSNPLNQANGGPVKDPGELFQKDSPTQAMWLRWVQALVQRWQGRRNILAWEIFSEVNLASGASEPDGIAFVNRAASLIRAADPAGRPVTASLADTGLWPDFYRQADIDFVNVHPYPPSAQLDRTIVAGVRSALAAYHRPVLIGESGLSAESPDKYPPNAEVGVRHAIWAALVSGAMNGRGLYWEDSYGIFFPDQGLAFVQKYAAVEQPAVEFARGIDFSGFKPLTASSTDGVWGAALGNESSVIGWYRDALCEPPDWKLQPVVSRQTVTISVPGPARDWQVDFYDTRTGTKRIASASVTRQGGSVRLSLPDFQDDIAFKMTARPVTEAATQPPAGTTSPIAGEWAGTIANQAGTFSAAIDLTIQAGCEPGRVCGTFSVPQLPCSGELFLQAIDGASFLFVEQNVSGGAACTAGGYEQLHLLADGSLSYEYLAAPEAAAASTGILKRP